MRYDSNPLHEALVRGARKMTGKGNDGFFDPPYFGGSATRHFTRISFESANVAKLFAEGVAESGLEVASQKVPRGVRVVVVHPRPD